MEQETIIAGVIVLVGILFFLFLSTRRKYRDPSAAQRYERVTEKLTVREPEPEETDYGLDDEDEYESGFHFSLANLIGACVVMLIGFSLVGPISEQVQVASVTIASDGTANSTMMSTTISTTVLELLPTFFGITIVIALGIVFSMFNRRDGLV